MELRAIHAKASTRKALEVDAVASLWAGHQPAPSDRVSWPLMTIPTTPRSVVVVIVMLAMTIKGAAAILTKAASSPTGSSGSRSGNAFNRLGGHFQNPKQQSVLLPYQCVGIKITLNACQDCSRDLCTDQNLAIHGGRRYNRKNSCAVQHQGIDMRNIERVEKFVS